MYKKVRNTVALTHSVTGLFFMNTEVCPRRETKHSFIFKHMWHFLIFRFIQVATVALLKES